MNRLKFSIILMALVLAGVVALQYYLRQVVEDQGGVPEYTPPPTTALESLQPPPAEADPSTVVELPPPDSDGQEEVADDSPQTPGPVAEK